MSAAPVIVFEHGHIGDAAVWGEGDGRVTVIATHAYEWLDAQCARGSAADAGDAQQEEALRWIRPSYVGRRRTLKFTNWVGVIQLPGGGQIEVLPKIGRQGPDPAKAARGQLVRMLACLREFRHIRTEAAQIHAARMPLWEVFIRAFLESAERVVKRGMRSDYRLQEGNVTALRGRLLVAAHVRHNLVSPQHFYTEHDEYSANRPENRLLHAAIARVRSSSAHPANQKLARELQFSFADIPPSVHVHADLQKVRLDRGMSYYAEALAWARLILLGDSPLAGAGREAAPSLLFPMERVFEAFAARHLGMALAEGRALKEQARTHSLVRHVGASWFQLKPDLLVMHAGRPELVLDTKWKLLDAALGDAATKYEISQGDMYQLYAYGRYYLGAGAGTLALLYPRTERFQHALPRFVFADTPDAGALRLLAVPFCLRCAAIVRPADANDAAALQDALGHKACQCAPTITVQGEPDGS